MRPYGLKRHWTITPMRDIRRMRSAFARWDHYCDANNEEARRKGRMRASVANDIAEHEAEVDQANWWADEEDTECSCGECLLCLLYVDCEMAIDRRDCSCWHGDSHVTPGWLPTLAAVA